MNFYLTNRSTRKYKDKLDHFSINQRQNLIILKQLV